MPGISGFVRRDGHIDNPDQLATAYSTVHALDGIEFVSAALVTPQAVIVNLMSGLLDSAIGQPARDSDADVHLFIEGEVFDFPASMKSESGASIEPVAQRLLRMYTIFGTRMTEKLNGEFNIVVFEKSRRKLLILADHLSTQPMYYSEGPDGLHFGSEKKSILATTGNSPQIDPVGLLQIFKHVHYVGDRTYIQGIKRLPAGGILEYCDGKVALSQQSLLGFDHRADRRRFADLRDEWSHRLQVATMRCMPSERKVVISLSAGLDSRAMVSSISRDRRSLWARTRGESGSHELEFAKQIASQLNIRHFTESPSDYSLSDGIDKIVWRTEGETSFLNGPTLFNHAAIKARGDFLAGGYFGDVASGGHIAPNMFFNDTFGRFVNRMYEWYSKYSDHQLERVFDRRFLSAHLPAVRAEFVESYGPLRQARNVDTHQLWDMYHRQTRMTMAAMPVDSQILQRISPFYDRELVEFNTRIPLSARVGQTLYKSMIWHIGPEIRHIPNSNTLRRVRSSPLSNGFVHFLDMAGKTARKVSDRVIPVRPGSAGRRVSEDFGEQMRTDPGFGRRLKAFCSSDSFDASTFDRSGILAIWDEHSSRQADHTHLLGLLGTFAAALPYFIYRKSTACPPAAQTALSLPASSAQADTFIPGSTTKTTNIQV